MTRYVDQIEMVTEECIHCHAIFAVTGEFRKRRKDDHQSFYCPACGKSMYYPYENEKERLKRLLNQERQCCISAREEANRLEKQLYGMKGFARKMQKQAKAKED